MEMTKKEEKMFEDNKKLVYLVINRDIKNAGMYGLNTREDLESIGMYALYKAILTYKEGKGTFANYAIRVIRNNLFNATRDGNDMNDTCMSTTDEYVELNGDLAYNNVQMMHDDLVMKEGMEIMDRCAKKYGGIAEKGVNAIKLTIMGYTAQEIAQSYGVEAKTVTAWISRARKKLGAEPELLSFFA